MKRFISLALCVGMSISSLVVVNAQEFTQSSQVNQFNTFSEWSKNKAGSSTGVDGWNSKSSSTQTRNDTISPLVAYNDYASLSSTSADTSNVYKSGQYAKLLRLFDETIATGSVHLSFDMLYNYQSETNKLSVRAITNAGANNNPNDALYNSNSGSFNGWNNSALVGWNNSAALINVDAAKVGKEWHKYDLWIDFTNKECVLYIDGIEYGSSNLAFGLKGLDIYDSGTEEKYIDNLYLRHYTKNDANTAVNGEKMYDQIQMAADCLKDGVAPTNGEVYIGYSECILDNETENVPTAYFNDDFTVKNINTGETVEAVVTKINTGAKLFFSSIASGYYEVTLNDTGYKGAVSGLPVTGKAYFTVYSAISPENSNNYLLNESFDDYSGFMPSGWVPTDTTVTFAQESGKLTAENNGTMKMNDADIAYEFARPVYYGKLNIEFDVKTGADGNWGIGLMHQRDFYDDTKYDPLSSWSSDESLAGTTKADLRKQCLSVKGSVAGVYVNKERSNDINTESSGVEKLNAAISNNEKTHVKIVADIGNRTLTVKIGNNDEETVQLGDSFFTNYKALVKNTEQNTSFAGLGGLRLLGKDAEFDNISVYANNKYNLYMDFNDFNSFDINKTTSELFFYNDPCYTLNGRAATNSALVPGRSGDEKDKAFKLSADTGRWIIPFNIPVTRNKGFDVEFDIKQAGIALKDTTAVSLLSYGNYNINRENGSSTATAYQYIQANGTVANVTPRVSEGRVYMATNAFIEDMTDTANNTLTNDGTLRLGDGNNNFAQHATRIKDGAAGDVKFNFEANKWYHVKLEIRPTASTTIQKLSVEIKDENGASSSYQLNASGTSFTRNGKAATSNYYTKELALDTYAVAFSQPVAKNGTSTIDADVATTIDNVMVTEASEAKDAVIEKATATNVLGKTNELSKTVDASVKKVELSLSAPLLKTAVYDPSEYISLTYADTGEKVGGCTVAVSDDGKSVSAEFNSTLRTDSPIVFRIDNKVMWKDSFLSTSQALTKTFKIAEGEDFFAVDEFRFYEYYPACTVKDSKNSITYSIKEAWAPVTASDLTRYNKDSKLKLKVSGYNLGDANTLIALFAKYDSNESMIKNVKATDFALNERGRFDFELENTAENDEMNLFGEGNRLKVFLWTKNGLIPVVKELDYVTGINNTAE